MSGTLQLAIWDFVEGFRDSFSGVVFIYRLHKEQKRIREQGPSDDDQPMTTLAKRRAERAKSSDRKPEPKRVNEPNVLHRICLCCAWNGGLFWLSILLFNQVLMPCLQAIVSFIFGGSESHSIVWHWIGSLVSCIFGALWILPLFVMSKVVNAIWFQDIADAAYKKSRGRPQMLPSLSKIVADILFSVTLQTFFLLQGMVMLILPIPGLGTAVYMLHITLLYALYSFEYRWFNAGLGINMRLHQIEANWPYYVGFGLPLAVLTHIPQSFVISGCVFSILFPLFIISGNEAHTKTQNFEFPLRIFSPVIALTNSIFSHSVRSHHKTDQSQATTQPQAKGASQDK